MVVEREFEPAAASAAAARRFLHEVLTRWGCEPHDVVLVASELVSNAIEHARTPFTVRIERIRTGLRIEVDDLDRGVPVRRATVADADRGRGLVIVEELCDRWGVDRGHRGKRVWCEFDV